MDAMKFAIYAIWFTACVVMGLLLALVSIYRAVLWLLKGMFRSFMR